MTTERMVVEVTQKGAKTVRRDIEGIGDAADKTAKSVDFLRGLLGLIAAGAIVSKLKELSDTYTTIQNQLKLVTKSTQDLINVQRALFSISQETRTSFKDNVSLYSKLATTAKELGASQKQLLDFTEGIGLALSVGGTSAEQASGALLQMSQALGSGIVRAEEFNSVLEGTPRIARAVAEGMKEAGGSVAKLRQLVNDGKVTSDKFFAALLSQLPTLRKEFAQTTPTLSQGLTQVNNALLLFVGKLDQSLGVSAGAAKALGFLARNFDAVGRAITGLAAGPTLLIAITLAANGATKAMLALSAAVARNPMGAFIVALSIVIGLLASYGDQIDMASSKTVTFSDHLKAFGEFASESFDKLVVALDSIVASMGLASIGITSFADVARVGLGEVVNVLDLLAGVFVALGGAVGVLIRDWSKVGPAGHAVFLNLMNGIVDLVEKGINNCIELFERLINVIPEVGNKVADLLRRTANIDIGNFGTNVLGRIKAGRLEIPAEAKAALAGLGTDLMGVVESGIDSRIFSTFGDKISGRAAELGADRLKKLRIAAKDGGVETAAGPKGKATGAGGAGQAKALQETLEKLFPAMRATRDLKEAQLALNSAVEAGLLTREKANDALGVYKQRIEEQLNPVGYLISNLEREIELQGLNSEERERAIALYDIEQKLMDAGVKLKDKELEKIKALIAERQKSTDLAQREDTIYKSLRGGSEEYAKNLEALARLQKRVGLSSEELERAQRDLRIAFLETQTDAFSGFERGFLKMKASAEDFASVAEGVVSEAFQGMEDAVGEWVKNGRVDLNGFINTIWMEITKLAFRIAVLRPLGGLLDTAASGLGGTGIGSLFSGGGLLGSLFKGTASSAAGSAGLSGILGANGLPIGFANGGEFDVGGTGGTDSQLVAFRASPDEHVKITKPGQSSGDAVRVEMHIHGVSDADSFRKSKGQIISGLGAQIRREMARSG